MTIVKFPKPVKRDEIDAAMLESMETVFEAWAEGEDLLFAFNPHDMAELMRRCRERISK